MPDVPGLEVTAASVNGAFVYELKVPLVKSDEPRRNRTTHVGVWIE